MAAKLAPGMAFTLTASSVNLSAAARRRRRPPGGAATRSSPRRAAACPRGKLALHDAAQGLHTSLKGETNMSSMTQRRLSQIDRCCPHHRDGVPQVHTKKLAVAAKALTLGIPGFRHTSVYQRGSKMTPSEFSAINAIFDRFSTEI